MDRRAAKIVTLALLDLCDRRGWIAGHDRKVIPQGGVGIVLFELVFHQFDQLGSFDRLGRISRQNVRKDILELVAEIHLSERERGVIQLEQLMK